MITIIKNPKKEVYRDLIDLACEVCDEFHIVLRKDMGSLEEYKNVLKKLEDSFIEMKEQSEWASTILGDNQTAYVYYYRANSHSNQVLKECSKSLYDWVQPNLPEDLSFFKNGKEWLVTISHEKESYILTEDKNEIDKVMNLKKLKVKLKG